MQSTSLSLLLLATLTTTTAAQQALAVDFAGTLHAFDTFGPTRRDLGPCGLTSCVAMTDLNGAIVIHGRGSDNLPRLLTMDPVTGEVLRNTVSSARFEALVEDPRNRGRLLGVFDGPNGADVLAEVSAVTGLSVPVGVTGFSRITALCVSQNAVLAWDLDAGLLTLDPATGAATDPFPQVGTSGSDIDYLFVNTSGEVLGGRSALFTIFTGTGFASHRFGTGIDGRGAVAYRGRQSRFGSPCRGGSALDATGDAIPGSALIYTVDLGVRAAPGVLYLGASRESLAGVPLPIDLSGVLGIRGCQLLVSPDVPLPMGSNLAGVASLQLRLPLRGLPLTLHAQHFAAGNDQLLVSSGLTVEVAR